MHPLWGFAFTTELQAFSGWGCISAASKFGDHCRTIPLQVWNLTYPGVKSLQSCLTLCDPIDGSPPGSPVPGTLKVRTLEWVAIAFSNTWEWKVKVKSLSQVRLSNSMNCSAPGSSIHGILQARVLEWGAIALLVVLKGNWMLHMGHQVSVIHLVLFNPSKL